jgi:hypothetical protein
MQPSNNTTEVQKHNKDLKCSNVYYRSLATNNAGAQQSIEWNCVTAINVTRQFSNALSISFFQIRQSMRGLSCLVVVQLCSALQPHLVYTNQLISGLGYLNQVTDHPADL